MKNISHRDNIIKYQKKYIALLPHKIYMEVML